MVEKTVSKLGVREDSRLVEQRVVLLDVSKAGLWADSMAGWKAAWFVESLVNSMVYESAVQKEKLKKSCWAVNWGRH